MEHFTQFVADGLVDTLQAEFAGERLLHGVDDRQFGGALLERSIGRVQFFGALRDLLFESLRPLRVVECDSRLAGQHAKEVAVGVVEASERTVDVRVEIAQQLFLRDQRRDDPRALLQLRCAFRAIHQADGARAAHVSQFRRDVGQQQLRIFAARNQGTREMQSVGRLQDQQHAFGTRKFRRFVDQELVQLRGAAQFVEAQAGVHQPLERLAQACLAGEVRVAPLRRAAALPGIL